MPIGVFDSGLGGISVLKELMALMPEEHYLYFGDSANAPYGTRTTEEVRVLTLNAAAMLYERGVKALVVACNTATAAAVEALRAKYPDFIIVGIEPALKMAADRFPGGRIGVMATEVTLREEKFAHLLERFPDVSIDLIPAPGLVECIEGGMTDDPATEDLLPPVPSGRSNRDYRRRQNRTGRANRRNRWGSGAGSASKTDLLPSKNQQTRKPACPWCQHHRRRGDW